MQKAVPAAAPAPSTGSPSPRRPNAGMLAALVNGVLAGVGTVYASTRSITVTIIAAAMALALAVLALIFPR